MKKSPLKYTEEDMQAVRVQSQRDTHELTMLRAEARALRKKLERAGKQDTMMLPVAVQWEGAWEPFRQHSEQRISKLIGHALGKLVETVRTPAKVSSYDRPYWARMGLGKLGGYINERPYGLPFGFGERLHVLQRVIEHYGKRCYSIGVEDGSDLLAQLSAGALTNAKFAEQVKRHTHVEKEDFGLDPVGGSRP